MLIHLRMERKTNYVEGWKDCLQEMTNKTEVKGWLIVSLLLYLIKFPHLSLSPYAMIFAVFVRSLQVSYVYCDSLRTLLNLYQEIIPKYNSNKFSPFISVFLTSWLSRAVASFWTSGFSSWVPLMTLLSAARDWWILCDNT